MSCQCPMCRPQKTNCSLEELDESEAQVVDITQEGKFIMRRLMTEIALFGIFFGGILTLFTAG